MTFTASLLYWKSTSYGMVCVVQVFYDKDEEVID